MDQRQLERLLSVGPVLAAGLDLEIVLRRIVDAAREVTRARYAALGVLDSEGTQLERFLTAGLSEDEIAHIGDLPRGRGVLGELIRNPHPLRLEEVGDHPRSYGFPVGHPEMHSFLGVPIRVRGEVYGNLYLTEKTNGQFDEEDEEAALRLADWAGIAIENARLYGTVRARHEQLERTVEVLETNVEIARAIGASTELAPVLELVVKRARALVEARGVALALVRGDDLVVVNVAGPLARDVIGYRTPWKGEGLPDGLRTVLSRDAGADAILGVPLVFREWTLGLLAAVDRQVDGPSFSANDKRLLTAFAASASIAVASAQRATQRALRQSIDASERERARWARELHDETLQDIAAVRLMLTSARKAGDGERLEQAADAAIARLADMGVGLRALIADLRPAILDQLGLAPALRGLAERAPEIGLPEVRLDLDLDFESGRAPARLAPDLELGIYRVVQEAVANAAKHANASHVEARIIEEGGRLDLSIRDDGKGFDTSEATDGFGLTGIRERVEQHGGRLQVESKPGAGTILHAQLPVRRHGDAPAEAIPVG